MYQNVPIELIERIEALERRMERLEKKWRKSGLTYKLIDRGGNILGVNADPRDLNALEGVIKMIE